MPTTKTTRDVASLRATVNGLTVIADPSMDLDSQRKVLRASAMALSTVQELTFEGLPDVVVNLAPNSTGGGSATWHFDKVAGVGRVQLGLFTDGYDAWRARNGEGALRHEFFHHFLETGGVSPEQKNELFALAHQVAPNGAMPYYYTSLPLPRFWPNDDKTDPGCKWWLGGGEPDRKAGEDFAYLLQEMYDGETDGLRNVSRPNFAGRKRGVAKQTRRILEGGS